MGFEVMDGSPRTYWADMDTTTGPDTLYHGQLVQSTGDGVGPLAVAAGVGDTTNKQVIKGVVVGDNNDVKVWSSTYNANYITSVTTQAAQVAREVLGVEGKTPKGDKACKVQIAEITAQTVLRAPIFGSATVHGTALSTLTETTGSATGATITTNATQFTTPVADLTSIYCATGANAGIYRITDDTSATVATVDVAFPYDVAIGDTFTRTAIRTTGLSYVNINTTTAVGLWLDGTVNPATHYYIIDVLDLDLSNRAGATVTFRFAPCHFDLVRT